MGQRWCLPLGPAGAARDDGRADLAVRKPSMDGVVDRLFHDQMHEDADGGGQSQYEQRDPNVRAGQIARDQAAEDLLHRMKGVD
jgi:hypothetical protein